VAGASPNQVFEDGNELEGHCVALDDSMDGDTFTLAAAVETGEGARPHTAHDGAMTKAPEHVDGNSESVNLPAHSIE